MDAKESGEEDELREMAESRVGRRLVTSPFCERDKLFDRRTGRSEFKMAGRADCVQLIQI